MEPRRLQPGAEGRLQPFRRDAPPVFPYYVGYLELEELKNTAQEALGEKFCLKDFHKFYLEIGPASFPVISDRLDEWIEKINNL